MAYFDNGVLPVDIKIGENKSTGKPIFIFYFIKEETKDVYEAWINHRLEVGNDIMRNWFEQSYHCSLTVQRWIV